MATTGPQLMDTTDWDIHHLVIDSKLYFSVQDIGVALECDDLSQLCCLAVNKKYRHSLSDLIDSEGLDMCEKNAWYVAEPGLWQWLASSQMPKASSFEQWLWETGIPIVREELNKQPALDFRLVSWIQRYYPSAIVSVANEKESEYWQPGQADFILHNLHVNHSGLAVWIKDSLGTLMLSEAQANMMKSYKINNFSVIVSDSFDELVFAVMDFMARTRICCLHCRQKFASEQALATHEQRMHKHLESNVWP